MLVGDQVDHLAEELFAYGADSVYLLEDPLLAQYTTDGYTKVITDAINQYKPEIVLFGATHIGRDLAPRVAARLNTGLTADCTRLDINVANYMDYLEANTTANLKGLDREDKSTGLKQTRPAFGGNLMATIVTPNTRPQMATVRPGVMAKREKEEGAKGEIVKVDVKIAKEDISVEVLNVVKAAKECGKVITCEEHNIIGGLGEAVCALLSEKCPTPVRRIGVNDEFGHSGPAADLLKQFGLSAEHIVEVAKDFCGK